MPPEFSGGGGSQINPQFFTDPRLLELRTGSAGALTQLRGDPEFAGFTDSRFTDIGADDPFFNLAESSFTDFLGGRGTGTAGIAGRTFQEGLQTGFAPNLDPLFERSQNFLTNELFPSIDESLGSEFGVRFGTPLGESKGRAARDVAIETNAQLLPFLDAAGARRAGLSQFFNEIIKTGGALGTARGGLREQRTQRAGDNKLNSANAFYSQLINALNATTTGGGAFQPTFNTSNDSANTMAALGSILSIFFPGVGGIVSAGAANDGGNTAGSNNNSNSFFGGADVFSGGGGQ